MFNLCQMQVITLLKRLIFRKLCGGTTFSELYIEGLYRVTYQYNDRLYAHVSFDTTYFRLKNYIL